MDVEVDMSIEACVRRAEDTAKELEANLVFLAQEFEEVRKMIQTTYGSAGPEGQQVIPNWATTMERAQSVSSKVDSWIRTYPSKPDVNIPYADSLVPIITAEKGSVISSIIDDNCPPIVQMEETADADQSK